MDDGEDGVDEVRDAVDDPDNRRIEPGRRRLCAPRRAALAQPPADADPFAGPAGYPPRPPSLAASRTRAAVTVSVADGACPGRSDQEPSGF
jgi:hypothetical protein